MSERKCENCEWWHILVEPKTGSCRRYPPEFCFTKAMWPATDKDDYCGEFCAKRETWPAGSF